jgi:hypothetical protein
MKKRKYFNGGWDEYTNELKTMVTNSAIEKNFSLLRETWDKGIYPSVAVKWL